jgi:hypothetical protein
MFMKKCLVLALLSFVAAGETVAAAARVDFTYGSATVSGPDGRERPLVRGTELDNGDTVRTAEGRAQLRFNDGAYVSLQPHSEFLIREYRFDGKTDGAERGFFGLARGAMRTVSGLIGRVNRDRYRVTTPTATIGIRGTGGVIQVLDDGSTLIVGTSGIWSLTNSSGSVDVPAGVSALAPASSDAPPQRTSQAPQAGPSPLPQQEQFRQGSERTESGDLAGVDVPAPSASPPPPPPAPTVLVSASGYAARFAYGLPNGFSAVDEPPATTATFDGSGQLTQADLGPGVIVYSLGGTHADFDTDGILAWGRWTGQVTRGAVVQNYNANQGQHYVVGMPTVTLPASGTASYALAGATLPTYVNGSQAPGTFTGSLEVTFGATSTVNTVGWQVAMPDRTFAIANTAIPTQTSQFSAAGIATQGCLAAGCTTAISGFFAGSGAERIGAAYQINEGAAAPAGNNVIGAAAFGKQ